MNARICCFVCVAMLTLCFIPATTTEAQLFDVRIDYDVDGCARSVAIGDLDGDGNPDLVVTTSLPYKVSVLLGNGDGTFQSAIHYSTGDSPISVAIGDLDGDNIPDLAVANYSDDNVSVLLGNGDGTFQDAVNIGAGDGPASVAIGDLDGDSIPDLVVANNIDDNVSVLLGNGDGTFYYPFPATYGAGDGPRSVAIDDLDGDGNSDLAVACVGSHPTYIGVVSILLGNGDGTFQTAVNYESGDGSYSVAIDDLDNDGNPDLAVANWRSDYVSVLLGNGDGTFQEAVNYGAGYDPNFVAIGDLDGDGNPDLAVTSWWGLNFSVLLGTGDGTFPTAENYEAGVGLRSLAIADLDGDGYPDLAVAINNGSEGFVAVLLGNGDGTFQAAVNYEAGDFPYFVAIGDLDGDSHPDLVVMNGGSVGYSVLLGNGDGTFQEAVTYAFYDGYSRVTIGDLDGDGNPDLAMSTFLHSFELASVSALLNNGDGTFQMVEYYEVGDNPLGSIDIGDFDGDGNQDLVVGRACDDYSGYGYVSVMLGNGDGTFQEPVDYVAGECPRSVAIGDLDGDGYPDLAVASPDFWADDPGKVFVLLGNGDGTFQVAVNYGAGLDPRSIAIGDLDGDSNLDLAVANNYSFNVSVLLGNGDGTFQEPVNYGAGDDAISVAIVDLDDDGYLDLAVANQNSDDVSVLINTTETIEGTISAELNCVPESGTLPLDTYFVVTLFNNYPEYDRQFAGQINVLTAGGLSIQNWRSGVVTLGEYVTRVLIETLPMHPTVIGTNSFTLIAEDITPAPYNQPPYPPSGDTDTDICEVMGIAP